MHKQIIKKIDLSKLPLRGKGQIDWKNSIGIDIPFVYDNINGIIVIKEYYSKKRILIQYKDKTKITTTDKLKLLQIGDLLDKWTIEFRYEVGDMISNKIGLTGEIVEQFRNDKNYKYYNIKCPKCNNIFTKSESNIINHESWCPICDNKRSSMIVKGLNDIWTTHSNIASQLLNPDDGYNYSIGTDQKLLWKCHCCNNVYSTPMAPYTVIHSFHGLVTCKRCSDGYSYPNKFIYNVLDTLQIDFSPEHIFDWAKNKRYDFYLPNDQIIIEAMGRQHYEESTGIFKGLSYEQNNDRIKKKLALENDISNDNYIEIDCRKSNPEFIMNSLKASRLGDIINLDSIDIYEIDFMCGKSKILQVAELVNTGLNITNICEKMKISFSYAQNYIYTAKKLCLC